MKLLKYISHKPILLLIPDDNIVELPYLKPEYNWSSILEEFKAKSANNSDEDIIKFIKSKEITELSTVSIYNIFFTISFNKYKIIPTKIIYNVNYYKAVCIEPLSNKLKPSVKDTNINLNDINNTKLNNILITILEHNIEVLKRTITGCSLTSFYYYKSGYIAALQKLVILNKFYDILKIKP